ncbi:MFS transporter [Chloroflexota bacterium]
MRIRTRLSKIFPGWWIVLSGGLVSLWTVGFYTYGFGALFKPLSSELGLNRATTSVTAGIGRLEGGFEAPLAGWITDKYGPRWIVLIGVFVVGTSLILMYFINSLWAIYIVWGVVLGTGTNMGQSLPIDVAISNWFVKKRGKAIGIKWLMGGLSGTVVLPLIAWLISTQGWRMTCVVGGVAMLLVGLPLVWLFMKNQRPEYYGLLPDGATSREDSADESKMIDKGVEYAAEAQELEYTLRQAMRTPAYWLLILAQTSHSMAMPAMLIHGIPFLTDIGMDPIKAAGMMAIMALASIPTRFISGFLADRVEKSHLRFIIGGAYLVQALGFALFLQNQTVIMIYIWFILYGIGHGTGLTLNPVMRARYFGRKAFGSIAGFSRMFMTPIGIAAPIYLGWVYDTTGNYISAFWVVTALLGFASIFMSLITPPKPPAQITGIRKFM